jgi:hypothetical protein
MCVSGVARDFWCGGVYGIESDTHTALLRVSMGSVQVNPLFRSHSPIRSTSPSPTIVAVDTCTSICLLEQHTLNIFTL